MLSVLTALAVLPLAADPAAPPPYSVNVAKPGPAAAAVGDVVRFPVRVPSFTAKRLDAVEVTIDGKAVEQPVVWDSRDQLPSGVFEKCYYFTADKAGKFEVVITPVVAAGKGDKRAYTLTVK